MSTRNCVSTGPLSFASKCDDEVLTPGSLPGQAIQPGEVQLDGTWNLQLKIDAVDVGNESGSTCKAGWGYRINKEKLQFGSVTPADLTTLSLSSSLPNATGGGIVVACNGGLLEQKPFHSVKLNISNHGSASTVTAKYWNGSSFAAFPSGTEIDTLAVSANGITTNCVKPPLAWVPVAAGDALALKGVKVGSYAILLTIDHTLTLTDISVVRLLDWVETLDSGNALSKVYIGNVIIPAGCPIVPYISTANAANWVQINYSQQ